MTRLIAPFMCGLVSQHVICKLKEYVVVYDTEWSYWGEVSLNNINSNSNSKCVSYIFYYYINP